MRARTDEGRSEGRRLVLVPTMGALHDGHLNLVREGLRHGDDLTVSIFVNPTQFSPGEDYGRYPRRVDDDVAMLAGIAPHATVFLPDEDMMYPAGRERNLAWIEVDELTEHLCGAHRPGHFRGVTTIVGMLFNICRPHTAVFGLKDAQQFVILKRMASDLHFGVDLVGVPTVREESGLALSSRNAYLTEKERRQATVLSRAVFAAENEVVRNGERRPEALVNKMTRIIEGAPDARIQYVEVVDAERLHPVAQICAGDTILAAVAVFFGPTRLIDSVFMTVPSE